MRVIAISGHAQNGKDTVAGMLKDQLESIGKRVMITHYADLLKYICKTFFGWDGRKDDAGRQILQYVGTDVVRKKYPDYWVDFVISIMRLFGHHWDYVIIPDARFPNELRRLKEEGFRVTHLRVVRSNFASPLTSEQAKHPSETALDNEEPDSRIFNDGSLDALEDAVTTWIKENANENKE